MIRPEATRIETNHTSYDEFTIVSAYAHIDSPECVREGTKTLLENYPCITERQGVFYVPRNEEEDEY